MGIPIRKLRRWIGLLLLGLVALALAEQFLIAALDYRAMWRDEDFKAYLANPGTRNYGKTILYDCQYRQIGWIYRFRICIKDGGRRVNKSQNLDEPLLYLIIIGAKSFFSPIPEGSRGRETWDRKLIWSLNDKLQIVGDRRGGAEP